ncbi:MAG: aminodeoxychorismate/anthranilate synthase component II [Planctomycetota bacterium]|nr:aminodeoxychorismate/anthranilate synthase component II [Planctomycetota bacterium]
MILIIDNYDSFVHNLARYFAELGCETRVVRNDASELNEIASRDAAAVVLSPGPCTPTDAGMSIDLVRRFHETLPILGVCLGHQTIAHALGGEIVRAAEPVHGRTSLVTHDGTSIFRELPNPLRCTRYHSLIIDEATMPTCLEITARTDDGIPMAIRHVERPVFGVQFHPESVLTQRGHQLLANFLDIAGIPHGAVRDKSEFEPPMEVQSLYAPHDGPVLHW